MNSKKSLLLHPFFLINLVLLLLNDFYFKHTFHNWFTGKLSDFAGLLAFVVFFRAMLPFSKKATFLFCGLAFCWWKSPLSDPLIYLLNDYLTIPAKRAVDYSDLCALTVLPFALRLKPIEYSENMLRKCAAYIIAGISLTAFTATSLPRKIADNNKIQLDKHITTKKDEGTIIKKLTERGLNPQTDTIYERVWENYYLRTKDTARSMVPVDQTYLGIYKKIDYGSSYNIPKLYVASDSIMNLQFVILDYERGKTDVWLHSFEYNKWSDTTVPYSSSYYLWRKFKNPTKKKFKEILKQ